MLPRVRKLEATFTDALVVIGIHAGKYRHERETSAIAEACRFHGIEHPVANDRRFRTWRDFAVAGWPTIAIVDTEGYVRGQQAGELPYDGLEAFIARLVTESERKGTLDREAASVAGRPEPRPTGPLWFPTGLAADIEGRLAVSDAGRHRVLLGHVAGNTFEVQRTIGTGEAGFADGLASAAAFREPQGLALSRDMLIVADRGNHAVRMVDLDSGEVATMAGTGELAPGRILTGDPLETALRSPWDVLLHDYELFIAMAGSHQIWRLDLKARSLAPHAGTGAESIDDGPAPVATLAQPMALATDGRRLYFADAESSSVRAVPFDPGGEVETLVGTGLFDFGDADGIGDAVRLQHAAGLAWGQGNHRLWVADTYNGKLKTLDPASRTVETVEPFEERLDEPTGLAGAGHLMYIADTNHHRLLRVDQIDKRVDELVVEGG